MKTHKSVTSDPPRRWLQRMLLIASMFVAAIGLTIFFVDSDLVNFFLPVRIVIPTCLLLSAGMLLLHRVLSPREGRSAVIDTVIVVNVVLAGFVYIQMFTAYSEVDLEFHSEGAKLAGTLYLPESSGPHPAVVIGQGSIRAPRRLYHMWADHLVRSGIAVFSFDKRGTGQSEGEYEADNNASTENLKLLASDVASATEAARRHPEIDGSQVGILGLSMGGWLAPLASLQDDSVAFMVMVAGPAVSVGEEQYYSGLTGEIHGDGTAYSSAAIDSMVAARAPSGFDPRVILRQSSIPTLWLFGGADSSVPTRKSVAVLDSLVNVCERPATYRVFQDAEHLGFVMKWPFDLAPGFIDELTAWIQLQTSI